MVRVVPESSLRVTVQLPSPPGRDLCSTSLTLEACKVPGEHWSLFQDESLGMLVLLWWRNQPLCPGRTTGQINSEEGQGNKRWEITHSEILSFSLDHYSKVSPTVWVNHFRINGDNQSSSGEAPYQSDSNLWQDDIKTNRNTQHMLVIHNSGCQMVFSYTQRMDFYHINLELLSQEKIFINPKSMMFIDHLVFSCIFHF